MYKNISDSKDGDEYGDIGNGNGGYGEEDEDGDVGNDGDDKEDEDGVTDKSCD